MVQAYETAELIDVFVNQAHHSVISSFETYGFVVIGLFVEEKILLEEGGVCGCPSGPFWLCD